MKPSAKAAQRAPTARGLMPFHRTVIASRRIGASFSDVERLVRVCLAHLVAVASATATAQVGYDLVAGAHTRRWLRRIRVPVVVEIESARDPRQGTIAHLRWPNVTNVCSR